MNNREWDAWGEKWLIRLWYVFCLCIPGLFVEVLIRSMLK